MRFFSNDSRETPDDEARADERPERVKSEPVAVPTQRPASPWAANPNAANLGATNSGLDGPGLGAPGLDGPGQSVPGPVAGKRPDFHEQSAPSTPFGAASGVNGQNGAGQNGAGGAVAAMAEAGPATDRGTEPVRSADQATADRTDDDWNIAAYDDEVDARTGPDGRSALDEPTALDNPITTPGSRGGPIALGGRTSDDTIHDDTVRDESGADSSESLHGDQPPAAESSTAESSISSVDHAAADAPAPASVDGVRHDELDDTDTDTDDADTYDAAVEHDDELAARTDAEDAVDAESLDDDAPLDEHSSDIKDTSDIAVDTAPETGSDMSEASTDDAPADAVAVAAATDAAENKTSTEEGGMLPGTVPQPELGPLFADADSHSFRDRWRDVQLLFVDDPKAAADDAAALVDEAVDALAASLRTQREQLAGVAIGPGGDTEQLRVRLRSYRDFLDRLLGL